MDETPIAHKYGSYNGAENDVGIIWAAQPFLLAVYTSGLSYGAGGNVDNAYADGQSAGSVICGQLAVLFKTYVEEQARLAQEQAEKEAEAARLAEEEAKAEAEEQARLAEEQKAAEEAAAEQARQTAHWKLLLRIGGVGIFSILVIALAVVLIRKLHKAGKC